MNINVRPSRERSRWNTETPLPEAVPPVVKKRIIPISDFINKGIRKVDCRVGDKIIDVDYIDIGIKRGYLARFLHCGYINLSNPLLAKVIYFFIIDHSLYK